MLVLLKNAFYECSKELGLGRAGLLGGSMLWRWVVDLQSHILQNILSIQYALIPHLQSNFLVYFGSLNGFSIQKGYAGQAIASSPSGSSLHIVNA